jgi:transcriptional regulator with XRE-family HTH domain
MKFKNEKIKELREQLGLSQRQFAKILGVARPRIVQYEGNKCVPGQKFLGTVCSTFNVEPNYFFERE